MRVNGEVDRYFVSAHAAVRNMLHTAAIPQAIARALTSVELSQTIERST